MLDFSQNAVQLPARTLVSDVLVAEDVATGNAMFAFFDGVGKLSSYALAATSLDDVKINGEPEFASDARVQFDVAALVALVCVGLTLVTVTEPPSRQTQERQSLKGAVAHAWSLAFKVLVLRETTTERTYELVKRDDEARERNTDDEYGDPDDDALVDDRLPAQDISLAVLRRMCLAELGLWYGLSAWQAWGAILVGKSILGGVPRGVDGATPSDIAKFQAGVLLFSLGSAGANLFSLLLAAPYPRLLRYFGARKLLLFSALVMSGLMTAVALLPTFAHATYLDSNVDTGSSFDLVTRDPRFFITVVVLAALGFPWAAHMNIPFSTVGRAYQDAPDVGLYMATLNTALCCAQLAMSLTTPLFIYLNHGDVTICFLAGAGGGFFAAYHAALLDVPFDESDASFFQPAAAACH